MDTNTRAQSDKILKKRIKGRERRSITLDVAEGGLQEVGAV